MTPELSPSFDSDPMPDRLTRVMAYLQGELAGDDLRAFEEQLLADQGAREQLAQGVELLQSLQLVHAGWGGLSHANGSDSDRRLSTLVAERLTAQDLILAEAGPPSPVRRWVGWLAVGVAASLLCALTWQTSVPRNDLIAQSGNQVSSGNTNGEHSPPSPSLVLAPPTAPSSELNPSAGQLSPGLALAWAQAAWESSGIDEGQDPDGQSYSYFEGHHDLDGNGDDDDDRPLTRLVSDHEPVAPSWIYAAIEARRAAAKP